MKMIAHKNEGMNAQTIFMADKVEIGFKDVPNFFNRKLKPVLIDTTSIDMIRMFKTTYEFFSWHVI